MAAGSSRTPAPKRNTWKRSRRPRRFSPLWRSDESLHGREVGDLERGTLKDLLYIDGRVVPRGEADIPWDAPGFRQGYGLFETIRIAGGRGFLAALHALRISQAAPELGIEPWLHPRTLSRGLDTLVERSAVREGALRIFLMPGEPSPGEDPAERPAQGETASLLHARYLGTISEGGAHRPGHARAVLSPDLRDPASPLVGLKTISYASERVLLARARRHGADEALRRNLAGRIAEGTRSNLFLIEGHRLVTPPLSEGLLAGITRWFVLRIAGENGLEPAEEPVAVERLLAADEAFLTSTLRGIIPLVSLDGTPIGDGRPGMRSVRLAETLERHITRPRE